MVETAVREAMAFAAAQAAQKRSAPREPGACKFAAAQAAQKKFHLSVDMGTKFAAAQAAQKIIVKRNS